MAFKMKGFPMQSTVSALKQTRQASPMKVAGGVFAINPADEEQTEIQIPTDKANKLENARDNLYKIIDDPNSTDKEIRQAERRLEGLAYLKFSGINKYTDPNSEHFIPELEGANVEQVHEYTKNLEEWSDEEGAEGYSAKNPEQQKLWEDLTSAVDFENTEAGREETRRQEMLDRRQEMLDE